jgi:hypothetical protein
VGAQLQAPHCAENIFLYAGSAAKAATQGPWGPRVQASLAEACCETCRQCLVHLLQCLLLLLLRLLGVVVCIPV